MITRQESIWKSLDWVTIFIYMALIIFGWFSVCGASYDYADNDLLDFSTRAGKQFVWIICSFGLGFVLLMLDDSIYDTFALRRIRKVLVPGLYWGLSVCSRPSLPSLPLH